MTRGAWAATAASSEIIAADEYRDKLTIQLHSGDITALGFGEAAVFAEGIRLVAAGDTVEIEGALTRGAVYAICDAASSSAGGYQKGYSSQVGCG